MNVVGTIVLNNHEKLTPISKVKLEKKWTSQAIFRYVIGARLSSSERPSRLLPMHPIHTEAKWAKLSTGP